MGIKHILIIAISMTALLAISCSTKAAGQLEAQATSPITTSPGARDASDNPEAVVEAHPSISHHPGIAEVAPPEGSWAGEFKFENDKEWVLVVADFKEDATGLSVEVGFPLRDDVPPATSSVRFGEEDDATAIQFEIPFHRLGNQDMLAFAGHLQDNKIVGEVTHGSDRGIFEFSPLADFAPDIYQGRT